MDAFARAAATEHLCLKRGVNSLAAIATAAPFLGLLGTLLVLLTLFRGISGNYLSFVWAANALIARALVFTAAGLAIGLASLYLHCLLSAQHARLAIPAAAAPPPPARR